MINEIYNILLADDHQMMIDGLKNIIHQDVRFSVIAETNDGQSAYETIAVNPQNYQILVTDISMPLLTGTQLCSMIKSKFPHILVLILSMYNNNTAVKEAIAVEADGYILKNAGRGELLKALHRIIDGGTYFSEDIIPIIYSQYNNEQKQNGQLNMLTSREKEILGLILKEYTSEAIAEKLFISKKTVDNHRQHLLEKTQCKTTVGLVKFAIKMGLE